MIAPSNRGSNIVYICEKCGKGNLCGCRFATTKGKLRAATEELLVDPARGDKTIAEKLGVSDDTAGRRRRLLELDSQIARCPRKAKDGVNAERKVQRRAERKVQRAGSRYQTPRPVDNGVTASSRHGDYRPFSFPFFPPCWRS